MKECKFCHKPFVSKNRKKNQPTCSKSCAAKYFANKGRFKKGMATWNKGLKGSQVPWSKGKAMSEETKLKISLAKSGKNHPNYGKHLSQETKDKISRGNKYKKPVFTDATREKISLAHKGRVKSSEHLRKLSASLKGKKHSQERIDAIINGLRESRKIKKITLPEIKIRDAYGFLGLEYTGNGKLWLKFLDGKRKNPDFALKEYKIAIEVFGDYWHRGENANDLIEKYNSIGWRCLVLWEKDIKADSDLTETINKFINYDNYEPYTFPHERDYGERYIIR